MKTVPQVRRDLAKAADELREGKSPLVIAKRLDVLTTELWRRAPAHRPTKAIRTPLTPELKAQIRTYARVHKGQDFQEIGNHFNVNPGRVSEIVAGIRK